MVTGVVKGAAKPEDVENKGPHMNTLVNDITSFVAHVVYAALMGITGLKTHLKKFTGKTVYFLIIYRLTYSTSNEISYKCTSQYKMV